MKWLQVCIQTHKYCSESLRSSYRPARLIDLGRDFDFTRARLVESAPGDEPVHYLALSYCWGPHIPEEAKTFHSTLAESKRRLRRSRLPRTFKHFFAMAKIIGVQYVWIDSLCILQDDEQDWQRETAAMGQIYSSAICTIAAESAKDCKGGIWLESGFRVVNGSTRQDITQQQNLENYLAKCDQRFQECALQKRGWAVQERELSPRVLHFTFAHVFWECRESKKDAAVLLGSCDAVAGSESGRASNSYDWRTTQLRALDMPLEARTEIMVPEYSQPIHNPRALSAFNNRLSPDYENVLYAFSVWRTIVEEYSNRTFSRWTDRLPALSGLASELEASLNSDYIAGIWSNDLHGLLWTINYNTPALHHSSEGPSWSWASVPTPVDYKWLHMALDYAGEDLSFPVSRVVYHDIIPIGTDTKGRCANGLIQLNGRGRLIASKQELLEMRHNFFREDRYNPSNSDYSESNPTLIFRVLSSRGRGAFALILKPSKEGWEGDFKRIGVVGGIDEAWFDPGFDVTIKIV